jgi:thiol-disulfide isomerase/thioredoxin
VLLYVVLLKVESVDDWTALLAGRTLPAADTTFAKWFAVRNYIAVTGKVPPPPVREEEEAKEEIAKEEGKGGDAPTSTAIVATTTSPINDVVAQEEEPTELTFDDILTHPFLPEVEDSPEGVAGWLTKSDATGGSPKGGFLSVVVFQVLWSPACAKVLPQIEELAPSFPTAKFAIVRADRVGVDTISRDKQVMEFPTVLVMRGSEELARIEGPERCVGRLAEVLRTEVTSEDLEICEALRMQDVEEAGGEAAEEAEEELVWSW